MHLSTVRDTLGHAMSYSLVQMKFELRIGGAELLLVGEPSEFLLEEDDGFLPVFHRLLVAMVGVRCMLTVEEVLSCR